MLKKFNPDAYIKEEKEFVYEKEAFGFYLNDTPFSKYPIKSLSEYGDGQNVMTVAEITEINERYDKRGNEMAFLSGVNDKDSLRLVVFSSTWKKSSVKEGGLIFIKGKKDKQSLIVNSMERLKDGTTD